MIIYKATNNINGKIYIGQTVRSLDYRIYGHIYEANNGSELLLHRAIRKYGSQSFKWDIIDTADDRKVLNEKECYWIKTLNSMDNTIGYNLVEGGIGWAHTDETKRKISLSNSGKTSCWKGKKNPAHSLRMLGNKLSAGRPSSAYSHKHTPETKALLSKLRLGKTPWNKGKTFKK
jgi:group I intron endonuclease